MDLPAQDGADAAAAEAENASARAKAEATAAIESLIRAALASGRASRFAEVSSFCQVAETLTLACARRAADLGPRGGGIMMAPAAWRSVG